MRPTPRLAIALVTLTVLGCGASVCTRAPHIASDLVTKKATCAVTVTVDSYQKCEAALADPRCTAADEAALNRQLDCLDRVETCKPGLEQAWLATLRACGVATVVSTGCAEAFR